MNWPGPRLIPSCNFPLPVPRDQASLSRASVTPILDYGQLPFAARKGSSVNLLTREAPLPPLSSVALAVVPTINHCLPVVNLSTTFIS